MTIKNIYMYAVCFAAMLFITWGAVDLTGALMASKISSPKIEVQLPQSGQQEGVDVKSSELIVESYYRDKAIMEWAVS